MTQIAGTQAAPVAKPGFDSATISVEPDPYTAGKFSVVDLNRATAGGRFAAHKLSAESAELMRQWLIARYTGATTMPFPAWVRKPDGR